MKIKTSSIKYKDIELIDKIYNEGNATDEELRELLENLCNEDYLYEMARKKTKENFENKIYVRGLIEFTNYCSKNCKYCGIRKDNKNINRYRLSKEEILEICEKGYNLGFRTFVLQGGEDNYYKDEKMVEIVKVIRDKYLDCAITLSIGEREKSVYEKLRKAGANRFLLRHETIHNKYYEEYHENMNLENRLNCLKNLKEIGFQTGTGFLIGLPNQVITDYIDDLIFIKKLEPEMVGVGPFIPHKDTPLGNAKKGSPRDTMVMVSLIRLLLPNALLPSTSALNTLQGFSNGVKAGANVIMLNLTPEDSRKNYTLYEGKTHIDVETKEAIEKLKKEVSSLGYDLDMTRGDHISTRI